MKWERECDGRIMNNKKIIMIVISTFIMGVLAGCSYNTDEVQPEKSESASQTGVVSDDTSKESTEDEEINDNSDEMSAETEHESGKVLVVYYSASGNTEAVANTIAETMKADIF